MIVIAFSGKKDSGKDTGANHLAAHYLSTYNPRIKPRVLRMADPLKKFCSQWFGFPLHKLNGTNEQKDELSTHRWEDLPGGLTAKVDTGGVTLTRKPPGPMTYREVLQVWGADMLRAVDPEVHCRRWAQEATMSEAAGCPLLFVTDVRFPNEIEMLLDFDADVHIVRLTRHPHPDDDHATETSLDDFDWTCDKKIRVLDNSETVAHYKRDLVDWARPIFEKAIHEH